MMRLYGGYLEKHFRQTAETPCWILLARSNPMPPDQHQPGAYSRQKERPWLQPMLAISAQRA